MNLSQQTFAAKVGTSREFINRLERGGKKPSKTLCILLGYLQREQIENEKESDKTWQEK